MIMTDIETCGIKPGCKIVSIGAVSFYRTIDRTFYIQCSIDDQPFQEEPDTMNWWKKQKNMKEEFSGTVPIQHALGAYLDFIQGDPYKIFWSKGHFDYPILEHCIRYYEMKIPWKYSKIYDYRTASWLRPDILPPKNNDQHNALSDALAQTYHLMELLKEIRPFKKEI